MELVEQLRHGATAMKRPTGQRCQSWQRSGYGSSQLTVWWRLVARQQLAKLDGRLAGIAVVAKLDVKLVVARQQLAKLDGKLVEIAVVAKLDGIAVVARQQLAKLDGIAVVGKQQLAKLDGWPRLDVKLVVARQQLEKQRLASVSKQS
jgi:hypothetical protein